MPRGSPSYTDNHADLFRLLANKDRLAVYGCLHKQGSSTLPELAGLMGWDSEDGTPDNQALRRHLDQLLRWGIVSKFDEENLWLSNESGLEDYFVEAINALCK